LIRLSDARPLTKVAIIAGILAAALLACALCAVLVALVGLKQIGPQMDVSAVPAWLWYYRGDPLLHLCGSRSDDPARGRSRYRCVRTTRS
jgi:type IV secretion system protein VirD4